jgi:hypothetical protein
MYSNAKERKEMNKLMNGKVITTIFNDRRLVTMLMGIIVCGAAIVSLLATIVIWYV